MIIFQSIVSWFEGIPLFRIIIYYLLSLAIQQRASIFGDFQERKRAVFSLISLFNYFRYAFYIVSVFLVSNHYHYIFKIKSYANYQYLSVSETIIYNYFPKNLLILFVIFFIGYFTSRRLKIFEKFYIGFKSEDLKINYSNWGNKMRLFFSSFVIFIISNTVFILTIILLDNLIHLGDSILINNHYFPFEISNTYDNAEIKYKNGFYIAIYSSILFFIVLNNVVIKRNSYHHTLFDSIIQFFSILIFSLGIFEGIYSVANFYNNYFHSTKTMLWFKEYISFGYLSVKITSILLMWTILKYTFNFLFKGRFFELLFDMFSLGQYRSDDSTNYSRTKNLGEFTGIYSNYYDNYFFIQIGFYIANVFVADLLISSIDLNVYSIILFALLPIMVDDFIAIFVYYKRFEKMDWWHMVKKNIFNGLLLVFSFLSLFFGKHYYTLTLYIIITLFLILFYLYNRDQKENTLI